MPHKNLLDPQGKAVLAGLHNMNMQSVSNVWVGKTIELEVDADSEENAIATAKICSEQLLANKVMEYFELEVIKK